MAAHAGAGVDTQAGFSSGRLPDDQVREMFERIAGLYDPMNTAMTAGLHHRWRARAADLARVGPGARVLDVATGTGDLALEFARRVPALGTLAARLLAARGRRGARSGGATIAQAYTYLPRSVQRFPGADALAAEMGAVGLRDVSYRLLAGGIVAIHVGVAGGQER